MPIWSANFGWAALSLLFCAWKEYFFIALSLDIMEGLFNNIMVNFVKSTRSIWLLRRANQGKGFARRTGLLHISFLWTLGINVSLIWFITQAVQRFLPTINNKRTHSMQVNNKRRRSMMMSNKRTCSMLVNGKRSYPMLVVSKRTRSMLVNRKRSHSMLVVCRRTFSMLVNRKRSHSMLVVSRRTHSILVLKIQRYLSTIQSTTSRTRPRCTFYKSKSQETLS